MLDNGYNRVSERLCSRHRNLYFFDAHHSVTGLLLPGHHTLGVAPCHGSSLFTNLAEYSVCYGGFGHTMTDGSQSSAGNVARILEGRE